MKLLDRDTNKDAIMAYLKSPDAEISVLSEKQQSLLKWYLDAYAIRKNYNSMSDTINVLVKMSKNNGGEVISQSTARRYIIDAQDILGNANKVSKQAALDYSLGVLEDAIIMARDQNDPKTMVLAAKAFAELSTKEDPELFDPEMLEQHIIEVVGDAEALQALKERTTKGVIDLDTITGNIINSMAEDAEIIDE